MSKPNLPNLPPGTQSVEIVSEGRPAYREAWGTYYTTTQMIAYAEEAVAVYASPQASEAVQLLRQVREQDFLSDTMRHRIDRLLDRAALASPETRDG